MKIVTNINTGSFRLEAESPEDRIALTRLLGEMAVYQNGNLEKGTQQFNPQHQLETNWVTVQIA